MGHQLFTNLEMIELINKIKQGKIKVVIDKKYSFSNALDALKKTETRSASEKSVVIID